MACVPGVGDGTGAYESGPPPQSTAAATSRQGLHGPRRRGVTAAMQGAGGSGSGAAGRDGGGAGPTSTLEFMLFSYKVSP